MKFKYLIIAFSIIIVIFLVIINLIPFLSLGAQSAVNLRNVTLPASIILIALLFGLNVFFLINYRLLSLLEREDWPALAYYLEHKIFIKGSYTSRKVRLLAGTYLVISDYTSVLRLESKALIAKPAVVDANVLVFGAARVLSGNYNDAAVFFKSHLEKGKGKAEVEQWVRWFYGFSRMLARTYSEAEAEFTAIAESSGDALITGLAAYFLAVTLAKYSHNPVECRTAAEKSRERVLQMLKEPGRWKKETEKLADEVHTTIIKKYIDEAGVWLFKR